MLGWYFLTNYATTSHTARDQDSQGMYNALVWVPIICALLQLAAWRYFTLKGDKLKDVKEQRKQKEDNEFEV
jgi:Na+/melibiose symporter-like transporter